MKPPALALERILALQPPSLRIVVPESWADCNGHMNMRWYVALFDDVGDELAVLQTDRVDLTPEFSSRTPHGYGRSGTPHAFPQRNHAR
jgi:hypothetical protein